MAVTQLPEVKITASKKPVTKKPTGVEVRVSKMGVLGSPGMDEQTQAAFKRMLDQLEAQGK